MLLIEKVQYLPEIDHDMTLYKAVMCAFDTMINPSKGQADHGSIREGGMYLAMLAMNDTKWKKALEGDDAA